MLQVRGPVQRAADAAPAARLLGAGILQIDRLLQLPLPAASTLVRERPV